MDVEGDRAVVSVVDIKGADLVGSNGEVLEAMQELTRLAVHRLRASARASCSISPATAGPAGRAEQTGCQGGRGRQALGRGQVPAAHDALRAQDRARCRRGGRSAQRVGGRGARAFRGRPSRLAGRDTNDESTGGPHSTAGRLSLSPGGFVGGRSPSAPPVYLADFSSRVPVEPAPTEAGPQEGDDWSAPSRPRANGHRGGRGMNTDFIGRRSTRTGGPSISGEEDRAHPRRFAHFG